jgi:hypothetical protein
MRPAMQSRAASSPRRRGFDSSSSVASRADVYLPGQIEQTRRALAMVRMIADALEQDGRFNTELRLEPDRQRAMRRGACSWRSCDGDQVFHRAFKLRLDAGVPAGARQLQSTQRSRPALICLIRGGRRFRGPALSEFCHTRSVRTPASRPIPLAAISRCSLARGAGGESAPRSLSGPLLKESPPDGSEQACHRRSGRSEALAQGPVPRGLG